MPHTSLSCRNCGASGDAILGVEVRGVYDGVLYWHCLNCRTDWNRWAKGDRLHAQAELWMGRHQGVSGID